MTRFSALLALIPLLSLLAPVHGFIGMGMSMYNPPCAWACHQVIEKALIACPSDPTPKAAAITPACRAVSAPFLTTLAYCIHEKCYPDANPSRELLEAYWAERATGNADVPPQWGWQETYDKINGTPTAKFDVKVRMTGTVLVDDKAWLSSMTTDVDKEYQQVLYARLIVFLVGIGIPILSTALGYLPFFGGISYWVRPRFIYPTLIHRHVEPIFHLFHIPTLGQTGYILSMSIITLTFAFVDYNKVFPSKTPTQSDIMNYLGMRTGIISMALLPLTILFAGRNNVLLYLTNWSHSTYLLLHRWIARLCLLLVILHSLIEFIRYSIKGTYGEELAEPFVRWGIVAVLTCAIMVVAAQFRRYRYELFLISHIVLAVVFVVGTWYHLEGKWHRERGYQQWIYLCSAIWVFDRLVRMGRVLKVGRRKATLTPIGDDVVRVDIEGVRWSSTPGQHAYLFLPAVRKWAPWENHPFSVMPTHLLTPLSEKSPAHHEKRSPLSTPSASGSSSPSLEAPPTPTYSNSTTSGITVYVKRNKGITASLHKHPHPTLSAMMDGPYRNSSSRPVLSSDRLILFAGGIGITGVLPFVHAHPNIKLYWSVQASQAALVDELERTIPGHVERSILVGGRNSVEEALEAEAKAGWGLVGVVVCGPGRMCDEVRNRVAGIARRSAATRWELDVEAFLW